MKTDLQKREATRERVDALRWLRLASAVCLGVFLCAVPSSLGTGVAAAGMGAGKSGCQKVILRGEVAAGKEWRAAVGEGWVFRVMPIVTPPIRSIQVGQAGKPGAKSGDVSVDRGYTGWDLVMDRETGDGYPDALLLATPPYGSVNEREIGTTFGMRAQDAIAWEPRKFHFFTNRKSVTSARTFYGQLLAGTHRSTDSVTAKDAANASVGFLQLISSDPEMGYGQFSIVDARLVAGAGDPPVFAHAWSAHLSQVPHTLEQASGADSAHIGAGSSEAGELRWIQFAATLWLPAHWKMPAGVLSEAANCAE